MPARKGYCTRCHTWAPLPDGPGASRRRKCPACRGPLIGPTDAWRLHYITKTDYHANRGEPKKHV